MQGGPLVVADSLRNDSSRFASFASQSRLLGWSPHLGQGRRERRPRSLRRERRYSHRRTFVSPQDLLPRLRAIAGRGPLLQHPHAPQVPPFLLGRVRANCLCPFALLDPQRGRLDGVQEGRVGVGGRQYAGWSDGVGEYWGALWGGGEEGVGRGRGRGCRVGGQGQGVVQWCQLWREEGDAPILYQSCVPLFLSILEGGTDERFQTDWSTALLSNAPSNPSTRPSSPKVPTPSSTSPSKSPPPK